MTHRANFILKDEIWDTLQTFPKGERSAVVNDALARWIELRRRRETTNEMDRLRKSLAPMPGSAENWIREDRDNH